MRAHEEDGGQDEPGAELTADMLGAEPEAEQGNEGDGHLSDLPEDQRFALGVTIGEPAGKNEERSVGPEKRGEKDPELRRGDRKFALECGRGDGERTAVDVGDEEGEEKKEENSPESERKFFGWRRGVQGAEIV